jgi:peroxiredoxin
MKRPFAAALAGAAAVAVFASAAHAALPVGASAPLFSAKAGLAGKEFDFKLADALKKGPVVLYFFPAAFTAGCTKEAHDFAEATEEFNKLGASVVGVTSGNTERVVEFSKVECRDKFAVAADPGAVISGEYDAKLQFGPKTVSNRTSYVIAKNGKIALAYTAMNPDDHVAQTMAAVKKLTGK